MFQKNVVISIENESWYEIIFFNSKICEPYKSNTVVFMETLVCLLTDIIEGMYVTYVKKFHLTSSQSIPNINLIHITITMYIYIYI